MSAILTVDYQTNPEHYKHITLSFDRLYFALILALVIAKAITGKVSGLGAWSDAIMCAILGIMSGRLSGICLRVRGLKVQHQFLNAAQG